MDSNTPVQIFYRDYARGQRPYSVLSVLYVLHVFSVVINMGISSWHMGLILTIYFIFNGISDSNVLQQLMEV